jgi:hypothetical protein
MNENNGGCERRSDGLAEVVDFGDDEIANKRSDCCDEKRADELNELPHYFDSKNKLLSYIHELCSL